MTNLYEHIYGYEVVDHRDIPDDGALGASVLLACAGILTAFYLARVLLRRLCA